jgi:GxxExxY protein
MSLWRIERYAAKTQNGPNMSDEINQLTQKIIGAAIEVHRHLGPGLLESTYRKCLCQELTLRGIPFQRELELPLEYKGIHLEGGYRLNILVAGLVVVEVKAVAVLAPIHEAQLLTYLRLGGWRVGLLINFTAPCSKTASGARFSADTRFLREALVMHGISTTETQRFFSVLPLRSLCLCGGCSSARRNFKRKLNHAK